MNQQGASFVSASSATHVQNVARALLFYLRRAILFIRSYERPDFVALDSFAGKIPKNLILIFGAGAAKVAEQFHNGRAMDARYPCNRAHGISLNQRSNEPASARQRSTCSCFHHA
jgi:hypothetical protein